MKARTRIRDKQTLHFYIYKKEVNQQNKIQTSNTLTHITKYRS